MHGAGSAGRGGGKRRRLVLQNGPIRQRQRPVEETVSSRLRRAPASRREACLAGHKSACCQGVESQRESQCAGSALACSPGFTRSRPRCSATLTDILGSVWGAEGVRIRRFLSHPGSGWQLAGLAVLAGRAAVFAGHRVAPPAGFEPAHTAPEAVALSPELWGLACSAGSGGPAGPVQGYQPRSVPDTALIYPHRRR